jgi:phytoene dehydrogenase-like protein
VLEAADRVGGAAVTREFAPGSVCRRARTCFYLLDAGVSRDLNLAGHGLKLAKSSLRTVALAADGEHLVIDRGKVDAGRVSEADRVALEQYHDPHAAIRARARENSTTAARPGSSAAAART